ncbi:MAG: TonB-dependent receptor [Nitrospira sp.]|nr:TonB-dependent receptor [Nitrospira sp.]
MLRFSVRRVFRACAFIPWTIALACPVSAEQVTTSDHPDVDVPEVIVSATKTPQSPKQVTSAVEVITGEDMQQRNIRTVAEALRWAQGLAVFQSGGPGTLVNVRSRGGTPEQTLVLIDGAIVNSGTTGAYDFANLTSDNIENIEILRGSQSMLWGSDAMGGVINITTKRGRGKPNISGFAEYGSFVSIREGAGLTGKKGPVDFSGTITRWDTAGFSAINYRRGAAERDGYHNWQGSVRFGADLPKDGRLEFSFRWLEGIVNFDGFAFNPVTFASDPADVLGAQSNSTQYIFGGHYAQPVTSWWSQRLTLSRATEKLVSFGGTLERNVVTDGDFVPIGFPFSSQIETASNRIEWQHNIQVGKPLSLTAGYQFREQKGSNTDLLTQTATFTDKTLSSNAGFGEAQLNLWDRVFGTAGIRYDAYNVFGSATTYRVTGGYLHRETGTKLRGSYATGFRAPTINELFFPGFGNPNLQPEKSQALDAAIEQTFPDDRGSISVGYFWTRYRNLILTVFDPTECTAPGSFGFCPQNAGLARAEGVEVSTKVKLLRDRPWMKNLDLLVNYTYAATQDLSSGSDTRLPKWPLNQVSTIISYQPIEGLLARLEGRYVGQRFNNTGNQGSMPSFVVWNLAASYDVTKQIQAYLRADNIFNEEYEEILYFGTPIRSIFGGVRISYDLPL